MGATINVKLGNGLTFNGNKIAIDCDLTNGLIERRSNGLYVPDLSGNSGKDNGSTIDHVTIINHNNSTDKIAINRDVVQLIFAMCAYKITNRTSKTLKRSSELKTIQDIINEINHLYNQGINHTSYNMQIGDLFMLKGYPNAMNRDDTDSTMEDGNRYPDSTILALFVVDNISSTLPVEHLSITCLWSNINEYSKGSTYSN